MGSIAIIGLKLGEKVRYNFYNISGFNIIDFDELEKVDVDIEFIKENHLVTCDTYHRHELPYYLSSKNEVYTDGKSIYCCDSIDDLYVNLSDIDDVTYKISENEKKLNKEFYSE